MMRLAKYSLLFAALSLTCWAQMKVVERMSPNVGTKAQPSAPPASTTPPPDNGIQYHGGPVMNNPQRTNVYYIWYGNWSNSPVPGILTDFIKNIGGTAYFNINTSYYDYNPGGEKDPVVNRVNYGGSTTDNYSYGTALTDEDVGCIIQNAATSGKLPYDPNNGVYEVLTSADVVETSGFCTTYCAFHGYQQAGFVCGQGKPLGQNLIGAFVGNPDQCPFACAWQFQLPTPNNSVSADGMANMIAHELSEEVTDPYATAWYTGSPSDENADLCLFTFGNTKFLPNGSFYNVKFGGRPWLIQQIWANARGGYCALALDQ